MTELPPSEQPNPAKVIPDQALSRISSQYLSLLERYRDVIPDHERNVISIFFDSLKSSGQLFKPEELILLDTACNDLLRIKQLQIHIAEHGHVMNQTRYTKDGQPYDVMVTNPSVDMLHKAETQFRSNLRELMLTKKEARKAQIKQQADPLTILMEQSEEEEPEHGTKRPEEGTPIRDAKTQT